MGRFTRGLVSYRPGLFLANLCLWSLSHMAPLLPGYVTKVYYDGLAGDAPLAITPWSILALLAAIGVTRALVGVGAEWLWGGLWTRATGLVRLNLLRLIAAGPAALATPRSSSETVSRVRDDVEEGCLPLEEAIDGVGVVGFAVGAIAIMAAIDWLLTCIVTVPIVLSALAAQAVKTRVTALRRAARNAGAEVAEFIGEVFGAFATFKLAPSIDGAARRLERLNRRRRRAALREKVLAQVLEGVSDGTAVACTSLLLFYLSFTGDRGFTVGEFVLFVTYLDQVADYAQWMMGMLVNVRRAKVSLARLRDAMPAAAGGGAAAELTCRDAVAAAERESEAGRAGPLQRLELRGVTYLHPAGGAGIRDIDLTLERGSFTVITGRIGAGKTTLLKVLLGLLPRQAGELRWNGRRGRPSRPVHGAAARILYPADAQAVQHHGGRQHLAGRAAGGRGAGRGGARRGAGAGPGGHGGGAADPGRRARAAPLRRPGAAGGGRAHAGAGGRAPGDRRPVERAGREDRAAAVGPGAGPGCAPFAPPAWWCRIAGACCATPTGSCC